MVISEDCHFVGSFLDLYYKMESHEHWSTIMANIATTAGFLGLVAVYFGYKQTQAHFSFSVMLSCIERFQRLPPLEVNGQYDLANIRLYVDLTNEEFFYFQRKYIPKEVIVEWLDSISMNFPLYANNEPLPVNYDRALPKYIHDNDLLVG